MDSQRSEKQQKYNPSGINWEHSEHPAISAHFLHIHESVRGFSKEHKPITNNT